MRKPVKEKSISDVYKSLHHYTTEQGLRGILENRSIWSTHYRFLNDRQEFQGFADTLSNMLDSENITMNFKRGRDDIKKALLWLSNHVHSKHFASVTCFCPAEKQPEYRREHDEFELLNGRLSQWRGDAPDNGYAIEFDTQQLCDLLLIEKQHSTFSMLLVTSVAYTYGKIHKGKPLLVRDDDKNDTIRNLRKKYAEVAEDTIYSLNHKSLRRDSTDQLDDLFQCAARSKHYGFHEENEIRIISLAYGHEYERFLHENELVDQSMALKQINFRPDNVPYIVLFDNAACFDLFEKSIKRIIIGPGINQDQRELKVLMLLEEYGFPSCEVVKSSIPLVNK